MQDTVAKQFDNVALEYDFMASLFHKPDFFLDNLSKNRQLALDIGCGSGHLVKALSNHYDCVIGIDISQELLEIAQARQSEVNIHYLCMNAEQIAFSPEFDLIVSENTFHHIEDVPALLKTLKKLLKAEGKLIIRDVISDTPTPARWVYLVGAVQELAPNIVKYGFKTAWRVFRFRVSHHWLNHLANDVYLSAPTFRELYASALPDCHFPDDRTVIWQKMNRITK